MKTVKQPENPYVNAYGFGTDTYERSQEGITLRDHYAGLAMQGLITHYGMEGTHKVLSETSYSIADSMLKQREL